MFTNKQDQMIKMAASKNRSKILLSGTAKPIATNVVLKTGAIQCVCIS